MKNRNNAANPEPVDLTKDEHQDLSTEKQVDKRGRLEDLPFDFQPIAGNKVLIYWQGKCVKIVKGSEAKKLIERLASADDQAIQLTLAKVTGNFKRGNERSTP